MSDNWVEFVSADPWFQPDQASVEQATALLRHELASTSEIDVRQGKAVTLFFPLTGGFVARCPQCSADMSEHAIIDWLDADYDKADGGFRLAPRTMTCCGAWVSLDALTGEPPFAFARFGVSVMNPKWKFSEALPSRRLVAEMARDLDWVRADAEEWKARHQRWSADVGDGEEVIAVRLAAILGRRIVVVHAHF